MTEDCSRIDDDRPAVAGGDIVSVAEAATARATRDPRLGGLVIVARTPNGDHRAVGSESLGPLRAAISVAVAADNTRLWSDVVGNETVEQPTRSMPEIVRAAAEASNVGTAHVGCIQDDSLAALAVWFEIDGHVASAADRRSTMELLATAAQRQREVFAERAATAAANAPAVPADAPTGRTFDADDPHLDRVTGVATKAEFEAAMENYDSDEATLVVVDLDGFAPIAEQYGETVTEAVLLEIADRLVSSCRRDDLIARLGPDTFAVLFAEATRSVGLQVAKRLLDNIAQPLAVDGGPESVTATIALAHQIGLVDMEELYESADHAVASGKRSGTGRLVVAS